MKTSETEEFGWCQLKSKQFPGYSGEEITKEKKNVSSFLSSLTLILLFIIHSSFYSFIVKQKLAAAKGIIAQIVESYFSK